MAPLCRSHDLLRDQLSPDPNLNRVAVEAAEAAHIVCFDAPHAAASSKPRSRRICRLMYALAHIHTISRPGGGGGWRGGPKRRRPQSSCWVKKTPPDRASP